jgi:hypothetical protein
MFVHFVRFLVFMFSAGFSYTAKFPTNNRLTFDFGHVVVRKHSKTSNNDSSTILPSRTGLQRCALYTR